MALPGRLPGIQPPARARLPREVRRVAHLRGAARARAVARARARDRRGRPGIGLSAGPRAASPRARPRRSTRSGLARLAPGEQRFPRALRRARAGARVQRRSRGRGDAVARTLAAAWPRAAERPGLRERARELEAAHPQSALAGRVRIIGAASAEQEAQAVDVTVREWLLAGKRRIAIVVQDRLVARRARALLERAQVLVKDEAGWAFSTTSAATAIGRWLDVAGGDCYYRDLLDLMKSPFAFHDWPRERAPRRGVAARRLRAQGERGLRARQLHRARRGEAATRRCARCSRAYGRASARSGADAAARSRAGSPRSRRASTRSALLAGLAADSAGAQLLELVGRLGGELAAARSPSISPNGGAGSRASSRRRPSGTARSTARWYSRASRRRACARSTRC